MGSVAVVHRWLGVCLCLMFALWFASGAVLLFVPFPSLSASARLAHLPSVKLAEVAMSPAHALEAAGTEKATSLRLIEGPGHPVYVIGDAAGRLAAIDARDGAAAPALSPEDAAAIARAFAGRATIGTEGPFDYDQWVVHQQFDRFRPVYRVALDGDEGRRLYLSAVTGDVIQQTTHAQRAWNDVGAVVHWIYPTIIRRSFATWDRLVWCLSLIGIGLALSGLAVGVTRARRSLARERHASVSPFKGLFRWHHLLGLGAGLFLLSWITSGWLSMDHGRIFSTGAASEEQRERYAGIPLGAAAARVRPGDLAALGPVGEVTLEAVGGQAFLVGRQVGTGAARVLDLSAPARETLAAVPEDAIRAGVAAAWPDAPIRSMRPVPRDDAYENLVTEPMTDSLSRVVIDDDARTWIEIDGATGAVRSLLDGSRRWYRWIYYGVHTFDLPGLSNHDALRRGLMLVLLSSGEALSLTGVWLGVTKLCHAIRPGAAARRAATVPSRPFKTIPATTSRRDG